MSATKAKVAAERFVAEINEAELVARIAETAIGLKRPPGTPALKVIADMERIDPETSATFTRIARVALTYFSECVSKGSQPS